MNTLSLILFGLFVYSGSAWDYEHQDEWGIEYQQCNGARQSPIDFNTRTATIRGSPIKFINYDNNIPGKDLPIRNNNHSVSISFTNIKESQLPTIKGSILGSDSYILEELHFHWGANRTLGSEHTFDGKPYALEGHLVHRNSKYPNISEAAKNSDGLTVLGIVYKEQTVIQRSALYPLTSSFSKVREAYQSSILSGNINLRRIFPAISSRAYYNYPGSLTTPGCNEVVNWIVYGNPSSVAPPEVRVLFFQELY